MEEQSSAYFFFRAGTIFYRGGVAGHGGRVFHTVKVDKSVIFIDKYSFHYWGNLWCIRIRNTFTAIGDGVFCGCKSVTAIRLLQSVTIIGDEDLYGCTLLTSVTLPSSLTTIDHGTFCKCKSLTTITLLPSLATIGDIVFCSCTSLTSTTL